MAKMCDAEPATREELLSQTYRSTLPDVFGYLLRRLDGQRAEAEELTQETYLAYVMALRDGEPIERPAAWLQTVARNKLVDHLRRRGRRVRVEARLSSDEPVIFHSRSETESLLHELPPAQRTAMVLRYLDDLSVAEVAGLLDRSVRATESLLARARRTLSDRIEREST
jgi:RNA polymerase sigma-70 factor (ECF subfamily)